MPDKSIKTAMYYGAHFPIKANRKEILSILQLSEEMSQKNILLEKLRNY